MARFYWDEIQKLAKAHHIEDPLSSEASFLRFLQFWWSRHYNRPLKDPLLQQYTFEELAYEWLRVVYLNPDLDPKKELEKKEANQEEDEWIREQLAKVAAEHAARQKKAVETPPDPPKPSEPEEEVEIPDLPDISTKFD